MNKSECRICLNETKCSISLKDKLGYRIIWLAINEIANVFVTESDGLPQCICLTCYGRLESCINFKDEIETADKILKSRAR